MTALLFISFLSASFPAQAAPSLCSAAKIQEVLEPAKDHTSQAVVNCNLNLKKTDVVTKVLVFYGNESSDVTLNCNGALIDGTSAATPQGRHMIMIRPRQVGTTWQAPRNVTIQNCGLKGSARIWWGKHLNSGVKLGGNQPDDYEIYDSSRRENHTAHLQAFAPKNIKFSRMIFYGVGGGNMVYFGPGVTDSSVVDSQFVGATGGGAIYLESESARNLIKNNIFNVTSDAREIISVDASGSNTIINNKFQNLRFGGIFLYRNCGEQGVIRHLAPDNNVIVNNIFDYTSTKIIHREKYGIYVSSRDGKERLGKDNDYCPHDNGYPYGSSADDGSPARNNIVAQNRFISQDPTKMIVIGNGYASSNTVRGNEKVSSAPARLAGCWVKNFFPKDFILHGQSVCSGTKITCQDGLLKDAKTTCTPLCRIELSSSNRLVVRTEYGKGLAFFNADQKKEAEAKLKQLKSNKTCR